MVIYSFLLESTWYEGMGTIWIILGVLSMVLLSIIGLLAKNKERADLVMKQSNEASINLLKARELEYTNLEKQFEKENRLRLSVEEELEDVTAEYRAISGIIISDLITAWKEYYEKDIIYEVEIRKLKHQIKVLESINSQK